MTAGSELLGHFLMDIHFQDLTLAYKLSASGALLKSLSKSLSCGRRASERTLAGRAHHACLVSACIDSAVSM
jgi:hypothetical protein